MCAALTVGGTPVVVLTPTPPAAHRCFRPDTLATMTCHEDTGEPIPDVVVQRLNNARKHMAGAVHLAALVVCRDVRFR